MILIRRQGSPEWHAPTVTAYDNEQAIQRIIEQSPHLLPHASDVQMVVASEVALPRAGYIDLVGVTVDGTITLVECKLKANPEIRRSVVGQVLAYAADLWDTSYEAFDLTFSARAGAPHELIDLTVPETRRLLALTLGLLPAVVRYHLGWSLWRRRHRAVAKHGHYRRRMQAPAHAPPSSPM